MCWCRDDLWEEFRGGFVVGGRRRTWSWVEEPQLHAAREAAQRKALRAVVYGGDKSPPFHLWHGMPCHTKAKKEAGKMPALQEDLGGW